jgi:hypothetical protein
MINDEVRYVRKACSLRAGWYFLKLNFILRRQIYGFHILRNPVFSQIKT